MELALNVTLVGISVVFFALIILSFMISIFSNILNIKKNQKVETISNTTMNTSVTEVNEKNNTDYLQSQDELVAVLTAAILASVRNTTECNLRVKSFRRISQNSPAWNTAGRNEYISGKL